MDAYANDSTLKKKPLNIVLDRLRRLSESDNIADDIAEGRLGWLNEEGKLETIGKLVCEEYQIDLNSRSGWEDTARKAMDVALQVVEPKNYPFEKAANIKYPLITVAATQFNARSYPEVMKGGGVVGTKIKGKDDGVPTLGPDGQPIIDPTTGEPVWKKKPGEKAKRARRVKTYMDNYITEEMSGWEEDTDVLLMQLPVIGDVVKKVRPDDDVAASEMITAFDFVVNQKTKSLRKCPRMTHRLKLYPYEIEERRADGRFRDVEYEGPMDGDNDGQKPHELLEQHRRIDLDGDGYAEPYIVTVHKDSEKVCRIVANFEADDVVANDKRVLRIKPSEYFVNYVFIPDPEGGFYGIGFGRLLESLGAAIDTTINQMLDAGHLQNAGGGFIGSGVRLKKSVLRMEPGVYHTVQASGDNLRNAIVNMEHPGPSAVLFNLLGLMIDAAKDITAVKDILTGESPQGETATTTLARIEQGMKVFTAIYKRYYRAATAELKLIYRYLSEHPDEEAYQRFMDEPNVSMKEDFNLADYDICPQADPSLVTDMQRMKRAEALLGTAPLNPGGVPEMLRRYYDAIGEEDVDKLLPKQQPDPMQEVQMAGAVAEVKKVTAEGELAAAKTEQTKASIGQEDNRQALAGLQAVDQATQHEDNLHTQRAGMVSSEMQQEADRQTSTELAKETARAKTKGQKATA